MYTGIAEGWSNATPKQRVPGSSILPRAISRDHFVDRSPLSLRLDQTPRLATMFKTMIFKTLPSARTGGVTVPEAIDALTPWRSRISARIAANEPSSGMARLWTT